MDLSRIPAQPKPGVINILIEIPAGSKNKYEFDSAIRWLLISPNFYKLMGWGISRKVRKIYLDNLTGLLVSSSNFASGKPSFYRF